MYFGRYVICVICKINDKEKLLIIYLNIILLRLLMLEMDSLAPYDSSSSLNGQNRWVSFTDPKLFLLNI